MPRNLIALGGPADVADVKMAGEEEIRPHRRELRHRHRRLSDQVLVAVPVRDIERVMRHDDPHRVRRRGRQARGRARHLSLAQPAAAVKRQRPRAVQADHNHFPVLKDRLEVVRDVAAVAIERAEESGGQVEQRHIVVAGDDDLRKRQLPQEAARLNELAGAGALRQVARQRDEIGREALNRPKEWGQAPRVHAAEVNVG